MALRFIEGFEGFGTSTANDITSLLALNISCYGAGPFYLDAGRTGGYSIAGVNQRMYLELPITSNQPTFIMGFGFKPVTSGARDSSICTIPRR